MWSQKKHQNRSVLPPSLISSCLITHIQLYTHPLTHSYIQPHTYTHTEQTRRERQMHLLPFHRRSSLLALATTAFLLLITVPDGVIAEDSYKGQDQQKDQKDKQQAGGDAKEVNQAPLSLTPHSPLLSLAPPLLYLSFSLHTMLAHNDSSPLHPHTHAHPHSHSHSSALSLHTHTHTRIVTSHQQHSPRLHQTRRQHHHCQHPRSLPHLFQELHGRRWERWGH